jgi:hypothetical protein
MPWGRWSAATAVAAVALAVLTWTQPGTTTATETRGIQHTAQLGYHASVNKTGLYADDQIRTGDPVFLSVAGTLTTTFDYRLGFDPGPVSGTESTSVRISAANGWARDLTLGPIEQIRSPHIQRNVSLDLAALLRLAHAAERAAGASFGSYTVTVTHRVDATGIVHGQRSSTSTTPRLVLTLTDQQATLQRATTAPRPGAPVSIIDTTKVTIATTKAATLPVLRWDLPLVAVRALAISLALLALALASAAWYRRGVFPSPRAVFGHRLVRVSNNDSSELPVVDVDHPAALARLADLYATVILHMPQDADDLFVVMADHTIYRLRTTTAGRAAIQTRPRRAGHRQQA